MHEQRLFFRTIIYFIVQGFIYGMKVGGLLASLIMPVIGIPGGAMTGGVIGLIPGLISGVAVTTINRYGLHPEMDLAAYRRRITRTAGLLNACVTSIAALTIMWILFMNHLVNEQYSPGRYDFISIYASYLFICLVTMFALVLPASFTTACIASQYADRIIAPLVKKKNDAIHSFSLPENSISWRKFSHIMFRKSVWLLPVGALIGGSAAFYILSRSNWWIFNIGDMLLGGTGGTVIVLAVIYTIMVLNFAVLTLAHRLYFDEYARHLSLAAYKRRLTILLALVTLVYGVIVTAIVFAPLAAFIAALSAREYADWHYNSTEKLKRSPQGF